MATHYVIIQGRPREIWSQLRSLLGRDEVRAIRRRGRYACFIQTVDYELVITRGVAVLRYES